MMGMGTPSALAPSIREHPEFVRAMRLVMGASLLASHALQSCDVQDFDGARCDPPNKAFAFQSHEGAFRRLGHRSKVIRKIEAIHRQRQERSLLIEELGKG